jgi:hypothetical protein
MLPVFTPDLVGLLQIVLVVVLPLLTALVTKESFSAAFKAIVLAFFSGVSSVLTSWLAATNAHAVFDWKLVVLNAFIVWALAVATYFGLWQKTTVRAALARSLVKD